MLNCNIRTTSTVVKHTKQVLEQKLDASRMCQNIFNTVYINYSLRQRWIQQHGRKQGGKTPLSVQKSNQFWHYKFMMTRFKKPHFGRTKTRWVIFVLTSSFGRDFLLSLPPPPPPFRNPGYIHAQLAVALKIE